MLLRRPALRKPRSVDDCLRDSGGVSAVEFALIAPFLILIYLGTIELSLMLIADRKVTSTASTLGDLVARDTVVDECDIDDIFAASRIIFQPNDSASAQMRVTSILNNAGTYTVDWSEARGPNDAGGNPTIVPMTTGDLASLSFNANLIPDGGSVIYAEVGYFHQALFVNYSGVDGNANLSDEFFVRPRRTDAVVRDTTAMTCP